MALYLASSATKSGLRDASVFTSQRAMQSLESPLRRVTTQMLIPYTAGKSSLKEMTFAEIADAFHTIDTLGVTPNWEGLRDLILRGFEGVAQDLYQRQEDGLIVSHGKTMSTLYYILTGETFLAGIKNGGLLELSWDGEQLHVNNFEPDVLVES